MQGKAEWRGLGELGVGGNGGWKENGEGVVEGGYCSRY